MLATLLNHLTVMITFSCKNFLWYILGKNWMIRVFITIIIIWSKCNSFIISLDMKEGKSTIFCTFWPPWWILSDIYLSFLCTLLWKRNSSSEKDTNLLSCIFFLFFLFWLMKAQDFVNFTLANKSVLSK